VARVAYGMAIGSDWVRAEIIDIQTFPRVTRKHRVGAIPKTFINYDDAFIGIEKEAEILDRVMRAR
jgi:hypothetical protein